MEALGDVHAERGGDVAGDAHGEYNGGRGDAIRGRSERAGVADDGSSVRLHVDGADGKSELCGGKIRERGAGRGGENFESETNL